MNPHSYLMLNPANERINAIAGPSRDSVTLQRLSFRNSIAKQLKPACAKIYAKSEVVMRKLFLAVLLALLIAGGGYWYWTTTPQYSMINLAESVRNHDLTKFRKFFDVESVSSHAVDDLSSASAQGIGGAGLLQRLAGRTLGGLLKPELTQSLANKITLYVAGDSQAAAPPQASDKPTDSQALDSSVESSSEPDEVAISVNKGPEGQTSVNVPGIVSVSTSDKGSSVSIKSTGFKGMMRGFFHKLGEIVKFPSLKEVLHDMGLTKENYRGLTPFQTEGNISHVSLRFQPADREELQVELELQESDNHWRVVRFSNLATLSKTASGI